MNLYGIFFGSKWCMGRNKRRALAFARKHHALVGVIRNAFGYGSNGAWDAPTFRVTMETIADFRPRQHSADCVKANDASAREVCICR